MERERLQDTAELCAGIGKRLLGADRTSLWNRFILYFEFGVAISAHNFISTAEDHNLQSLCFASGLASSICFISLPNLV